MVESHLPAAGLRGSALSAAPGPRRVAGRRRARGSSRRAGAARRAARHGNPARRVRRRQLFARQPPRRPKFFDVRRAFGRRALAIGFRSAKDQRPDRN